MRESCYEIGLAIQALKIDLVIAFLVGSAGGNLRFLGFRLTLVE